MNTLVQPPPEFFGRTIFAEDIRVEKSGQLTIVGMYPSGIDIEQYPAVLPRLAMLIEFQWRLNALTGPARLAAFMTGASADEPLWQATLAPPEPEPPVLQKITQAEEQGPYPGELVSRATNVVNMVNLQVPRPGMLQVRAFVGDKVFSIGGLHFSTGDNKTKSVPTL